MKKKKINFRFSSLATTLSCLMMGLFVSTTSMAQPSGAGLQIPGCTSGDVQIVGAYLSNASGVQLTSYVCGSGVPVYLTLQLTTKTPGVGVSIYADIQTVSGTPPTLQELR
jgi:hypothetical protein